MPKEAADKSTNAAAAVAAVASSSNSKSAPGQRFSRTKTGCFTCRARRKKCDEARDPNSGACARCRNSGIECLGFPPLRSAPASAHKKQSVAQARLDKALQRNSTFAARHQVAAATTRPTNTTTAANVTAPSTLSITPFSAGPIAESNAVSDHNSLSSLSIPAPQHGMTYPEDGVARWADLMALDDGEQLFYEGIFFDNSVREPAFGGITTETSSRAISVDVGGRDGAIDSASISGPPAARLDDIRREDRAMTVLCNFYAMTCWYRWQPAPRSCTKEQLAMALKTRMETSEVLCISVASLAACYGFGQYIDLPQSNIQRSFLKHWDSVYDVVTSTKTRKLSAFLEWLGETSGLPKEFNAGGVVVTSSDLDKAERPQAARKESKQLLDIISSNNERQRDKLFSLTSQVLQQIAQATNQDQELPMDRSSPLDAAALLHVDKYLHAAMDLATFAYASRSHRAFHEQLDAASHLLNSLLGQSQCVDLYEMRGTETTGFRTFAWADIVNAVLCRRSTHLHYLSVDEAIRLRKAEIKDKQRRGVRDGAGGNFTNDSDDDDSNDDSQDNDEVDDRVEFGNAENGRIEHDNSHRSKYRDAPRITFGCPDDVLVILASIANLHVQLLQARNDSDNSLPAWAIHAALNLRDRLRSSQRMADDATAAVDDEDKTKGKSGSSSNSTSKSGSRSEHASLATMWRHAAVIFLNTTVYRQGPLSESNQEHLQGILTTYKQAHLRQMKIAMGGPAMPILAASFVALSREDRRVCLEALRQIGQREVARESYRTFVQRLWRKSDETGFGILWHDMLQTYPEALAML